MLWTLPGVDRALRGLRTGDRRLVLSGAALLAYALYKRRAGRRRVVYRTTLREGQRIAFRLADKGRPPFNVESLKGM